MKLIYKLFHQDPENRESIIFMTSGLGIFTNIAMALAKILIGIMASSIAIVSEGINNSADVLTSLLTLIGTRLAKKHPDEKHPFGYGRIEYLVSLVIAVMIIVTGIEMTSSSVKLIINPEPLKISYWVLVIVAGSAMIKFLLGIYTIQMGKKADSNALIGVGVESRNDAFASIITIVSSLVFLIFHVSVDAYAGILISLLILKAGFDLLKDTVGDLLGRPGEYELAQQLYKEIRGTEGIILAVDMMLHNYGPDAWSGSVNVEIDHEKTVGEVYQILHELQLRIMHEYHTTMVFGVYAVDNDHPKLRELRTKIGGFVREQEHVKSYHALFLDEKEHKLYCDFIVDYKIKDWDQLRNDFIHYLGAEYPEYEVELTIETEFV